MYTINDARREIQELLEEGYGANAIRIFLNDLSRGNDITWEENKALFLELSDMDIDCSYSTY